MRLEIWTQPNDRTRAKPKRRCENCAAARRSLDGLSDVNVVGHASWIKTDEVKWIETITFALSSSERVFACVYECQRMNVLEPFTQSSCQFILTEQNGSSFILNGKQTRAMTRESDYYSCRTHCMHLCEYSIRKRGEHFMWHTLILLTRNAMHCRLHRLRCMRALCVHIVCHWMRHTFYRHNIYPYSLRHHRFRFIHFGVLRCVCFDL